MPFARREAAESNEFTVYHCRQLELGADPVKQAWGEFAPERRRGRFHLLSDVPPAVLDEMTACWELHGAEIERQHVLQHPGRRPWFWWVAIALPAEPRQRIEAYDDDFEDRSNHPPADRPWRQSAGWESGVRYLRRRGLLLPAEIAALRPLVTDALQFARRYAPTGASEFHGADLATIRDALGADLLTDGELAAASAWEARQ